MAVTSVLLHTRTPGFILDMCTCVPRAAEFYTPGLHVCHAQLSFAFRGDMGWVFSGSTYRKQTAFSITKDTWKIRSEHNLHMIQI